MREHHHITKWNNGRVTDSAGPYLCAGIQPAFVFHFGQIRYGRSIKNPPWPLPAGKPAIGWVPSSTVDASTTTLSTLLVAGKIKHGVDERLLRMERNPQRLFCVPMLFLQLRNAPGRTSSSAPSSEIKVANCLTTAIFGLGQDVDQRDLGPVPQGGVTTGKRPDKFRNQTVFDEILRLNDFERFGNASLLFASNSGTETNARCLCAVFMTIFQSCKRTTTNKQNVGRVHLNEVLIGMLCDHLEAEWKVWCPTILGRPAEHLHPKHRG